MFSARWRSERSWREKYCSHVSVQSFTRGTMPLNVGIWNPNLPVGEAELV